MENMLAHFGGEVHLHKDVLGRIMEIDEGLRETIGYLMHTEHTGSYVALSKVRDLLRGSGRGFSSKVLYALTCPEDELPDIILSDPSSLESSLASSRLHLPSPDKSKKFEEGTDGGLQASKRPAKLSAGRRTRNLRQAG
jgi:hypothetical protein